MRHKYPSPRYLTKSALTSSPNEPRSGEKSSELEDVSPGGTSSVGIQYPNSRSGTPKKTYACVGGAPHKGGSAYGDVSPKGGGHTDNSKQLYPEYKNPRKDAVYRGRKEHSGGKSVLLGTKCLANGRQNRNAAVEAPPHSQTARIWRGKGQ